MNLRIRSCWLAKVEKTNQRLHFFQIHRFCVLPPLKNHPSHPIGFVYSPLWKITHPKPSVLCTPPFENPPTKAHRFHVLPPFEKSPITAHRFCVLPPLKNHPSQPIGFVYSPLWKITVFGGRLVRQIRYDIFTPIYSNNCPRFGCSVEKWTIRHSYMQVSFRKEQPVYIQRWWW